MNERKITYEILQEVIIKKGYANLIMRKYKDLDISFNFVTEVVYGVLRNYDLLKYQYQNLISKKIEQKAEILLNMAIYELQYMNSENYYVCNEIVNLANKYQKNFINAILRNYLKQGFNDDVETYLLYSIPKWVYNLWVAHYGSDNALAIAKASNHKLDTFYRLNPLVANYQMIEDLNINIIDDQSFTSSLNLIKSSEFKKGYFVCQDLASASIVKNLELKKTDIVLDLCAAPGTKTSQIAAILENNSEIYALDLHSHRVKLIDELMDNLGITNVKTMTYDSTVYNKEFINKFDKILLDVPCSGLGVLSRKPDIKLNIEPSSLDEIVATQKSILDNAYNYLKINGILVYSTCTLNKKENDRQIKEFINKYQDMEILNEETIFPFINDTDGFYFAKMKKRGKNG